MDESSSALATFLAAFKFNRDCESTDNQPLELPPPYKPLLPFYRQILLSQNPQIFSGFRSRVVLFRGLNHGNRALMRDNIATGSLLTHITEPPLMGGFFGLNLIST